MNFVRIQNVVFIGVFAFFCSPAPGLTQQEMQAAVEAALSNWTLSDPNAFLSYPRDTQGRNLSRYLASQGSSSPVAYSIGWWMPVLNDSVQSLFAITNVVADWHDDAERFYYEVGELVDGVIGSLGHIYELVDELGGLVSVPEAVGSVRDDVGRLVDFSSTSTVFVAHIDSDLHSILDDLYSLEYMLNGAMIEILDALDFARGSNAGFYGWITNSLVGALDGLRVTLDEPIHVIADNLDWFSDWESTNTLLLTSIGRDSRNLNTNFLAFYRDWRNVYLPSATNYFSSAMLTDSQSFELASSTNAFVTNLVFDALAVSNLQEQALRDEADSTNRLAEVFDQHFVENPYDGGDSVISNLGSSAMDLVGNVDPATTSDVIIMGSVDLPPSRSVSRVSWAYWVHKLPRIGFDMEQIFVRSRRLVTVKNLFAAVWLIVGVFYKLILLSRFADWFSRVSKK